MFTFLPIFFSHQLVSKAGEPCGDGWAGPPARLRHRLHVSFDFFRLSVRRVVQLSKLVTKRTWPSFVFTLRFFRYVQLKLLSGKFIYLFSAPNVGLLLFFLSHKSLSP